MEPGPLVRISEGPMSGGPRAVGVATAPSPPRNTELMSTVVAWGRISLEEDTHAGTELQRTKFGVAHCVHDMLALSGRRPAHAAGGASRASGSGRRQSRDCGGGGGARLLTEQVVAVVAALALLLGATVMERGNGSHSEDDWKDPHWRWR